MSPPAFAISTTAVPAGDCSTMPQIVGDVCAVIDDGDVRDSHADGHRATGRT